MVSMPREIARVDFFRKKMERVRDGCIGDEITMCYVTN